MSSVYAVNKGINKSIEFRGLKSQYIWYFGAGVLLLLVLFAIMYIIGLNSYVCIAVILALGTGLTLQLYAMSGKYGEHGLAKKLARRRIPKVIRCNSRTIFIQPGKKSGKQTPYH